MPKLPNLEGATEAVSEHLLERDRAASEAPEDAEIVGRLCLAYHADVFYPQAERCYRRAEELAPDDWRWKYYMVLFVFFILLTMISERFFEALQKRASRGMSLAEGGNDV